ncbi:LysR family transcriptional regulator [Vibrio lentus]|uniref:Transcriptional regulator n=1 Tax=Vibrio lentus TaxID=136468 RepID=A0AB36XR56_9VIBR|nr:LysR family transcriptional regulator [Vibrio lentus]MCC4839101.1 LysR family transcriptional regulator [Vibrio lentus]MDH5926766.1 LysR family transcriptional regulator [Vibrio lentus]PMI11390.1 transcriptional regulator [Vibrio lentus]PMK37883.1 transcriptional regulator [Vibrio lentus]PMK49393.1 transcriptional regulator [Vibrio lentus]
MLDKMAFFIYVVRTGSISAAARKLNISVSAGSRWLQELEQKFGMPLYRRNNRLLKPTPAGQTLFDQFSVLVDQSETVMRTMQDYQKHDKGHIDVICTPVYANHFLMNHISEYLLTNPEITFNLNITPWALDHAADSDITISANASYQGYREKDLHLVRREIMQSPFVVVASPSYLARNNTPQRPSELKAHLCLFATTLTGSNDWVFTQDNECQIIKIPKSLEVNDSDLLLQAALNGTGIAYLPQFLVEKHINDKTLVPIFECYDTSIWSLNMYYQPATTASAVAIHFKDFLLAKH